LALFAVADGVFGDAVGIALGRRRRSSSWAVGFGNPRSQQHSDWEILRSQYEAIFLILGNLQTSST
jgi:hypothetical protein